MKFTEEIEKLMYDEFLSIAKDGYQEKVRYYERNKSDIRKLAFDVRIIIELHYATSLYKLQEYYSFLDKADYLITTVIAENINLLDGKDIFRELVYMKAMALHKTIDYYKADYVFKELVRMDATEPKFIEGFRNNAYELYKYKYKNLNAVSVLFFILSAMIIGVELLMIRPLYPEYVYYVEMVRNILFFSGVGTIIFLEGYTRYKSNRTLQNIL